VISLTLPFPPSVNTYWRHPTTGKLAGRHLISEKGRAYRTAVLAAVLGQRRNRKLDGRLSVQITAHVPDRRQRDLDNMLKALLDALTHAGVWADDSAIDRLEIKRGSQIDGGRVLVEIVEMEEADQGAFSHGASGSIIKP